MKYSLLKIYLLMTGGQHWIGGVQYTRNIIRAINLLPKNEIPEIFLSLGEKNANQGYEEEFSAYDFIRIEKIPFWLQTVFNYTKIFFGVKTQARLFSFVSRFAIRSTDKCTVAYPVKGSPLKMDIESVLWIPDFQYKCMPEYFSVHERQLRDSSYAAMLDNDLILVLSSESVKKDFERFFPEYENKRIRILNFISTISESEYLSDPDKICAKYGLPDKFVYLPNQFFKHKRHDMVFLALAKLKALGIKVNLVCTGNSLDYRSPEYYYSLNKFIHDCQLNDQVKLLGLVSRNDQIQIFRKAAFILQPSIFEGWSTTVEDGIALGKTILLSDISTHREQNPKYCKFFKAESADSLIESIRELWGITHPGPDIERESLALIENRNRGLAFARTFLDIMVEASSRNRKE